MSYYYNTRVTYIGNGTTTDFSIPFPYDKDTELNVVVAGSTVGMPFTVPSTGVVRFSTPPASGARFTIYRDTDNTAPAVVWNVNTSVRSTLLNSMVHQLAKSIQELKDSLFEALNGAATGIVGVVGVLQGGTGMTGYVTGDMIVATAPTTLSRFPDVAKGFVLRSGGVGVVPFWGRTNISYGTVTNGSGSVTIDRNTAEAQRLTVTGNITSMSFTNFGTVGDGEKLLLEVWNTGAYTVVWPAAVKWASSTIPVVTSGAGKKDLYVFYTGDAGTTIYGTIIGQNYG